MAHTSGEDGEEELRGMRMGEEMGVRYTYETVYREHGPSWAFLVRVPFRCHSSLKKKHLGWSPLETYYDLFSES